ncbi:hypothetical protein [Fictibacillus barbaricus]|uniref:Transposase n=1 Tax=Fictibacillus barbaricus TaxID=182136 RepID=A0ABU1TWR2_9BACL|nr:hypothetical protein [Fictibacillus barbaricus]MDR7071650.1 transposase [Fictibacillus barbaricus]
MKHKRMTEKKVLKYFLVLGVFLYLLTFLTPVIHLPIGWSNVFVGIQAEPSYLPFKYEKSYMTSRSCGKSCEKLKLHYEAPDTELLILATDYVSWYDDPKWDKRTKIKGTKYFYREKNKKQYLYWKEEKEELELGIEYKGENSLPQSEMVKIADSITPEGRLLN